MADYKLILSHIAKALVDEPDEVVVLLVEEDDSNVTLELSVAPDDMGKVIGKHGKIAKAIRTVMRAAAMADNRDVNVEIR